MCCFSHGLETTELGGRPAEREEFRCRCTCGGPGNRCVRRAAHEDMLCEFCRDEPLADEVIRPSRAAPGC